MATSQEEIERRIERDTKQLHDAAYAWADIAATAAGKRALKDLEARFYDCHIGGPQMAEQVGARNVVRYIKGLIRGAKDPDSLKVTIVS